MVWLVVEVLLIFILVLLYWVFEMYDVLCMGDGWYDVEMVGV